MRVMIIVKADENSEAGRLPTRELLEAMGKFNEELVKAGVMLAGEGLQPSSRGVRVKVAGPKRTVIDGPFSETKELIAGFWIWQVKSLADAIEWVKRSPFGRVENPYGDEAVLEIRPLHEAEDFGEAFTPEAREREQRLRAELAQRR